MKDKCAGCLNMSCPNKCFDGWEGLCYEIGSLTGPVKPKSLGFKERGKKIKEIKEHERESRG